MGKTQILITDVPTTYFKDKWPEKLEKELFDVSFPQFKSQLQYYTPLAFLNRIIIIMDNEDITLEIFEHVKNTVKTQKKDVKLYLTESLLANTRSKSSDDVSRSVLERDSFDRSGVKPEEVNREFSPVDKPILSIDTNPLSTGVNSSSLSVGSPSLSPDRTSLESPTMLKFDNESKMHYYKEPLPRLHKRDSQSTDISLSGDNTKYLFKPRKDSTGAVAALSSSNINVPPSPSITLNEFNL